MDNDESFKPLTSDLPARVAQAFLVQMAAEGVQLQFDEASLTHSFDSILDDRERFEGRYLEVAGASYDLATAAGCFFGETLRRRYAGTWLGRLDRKAGVNFYTVRIQFGDYRFSPFCWLSYRLSNGRSSVGSVESCLAAVTPSMRDGMDYKRQKQNGIIKGGGVVTDSDVWG